jgi:hypothetical protein
VILEMSTPSKLDFDIVRRLMIEIFQFKNVDVAEMGRYEEAIDGFKWITSADANLNNDFQQIIHSLKQNWRNCRDEMQSLRRMDAHAALMLLNIDVENVASFFEDLLEDIDATRKDVRFFPTSVSSKVATKKLPKFKTKERVRLTDAEDPIVNHAESGAVSIEEATDFNEIYDLLITIWQSRNVDNVEPAAPGPVWKNYPWKGDVHENLNESFFAGAEALVNAANRCQDAIGNLDDTDLLQRLCDLRNVAMEFKKMFDNIAIDISSIFLDRRLNWQPFPEGYAPPGEWHIHAGQTVS